MGLEKIKLRDIRKARTALIVFATVIVGVLIARHPMEVYAVIDPGLDSGNAIVDRTSVPGQTILKYTTAGNSTFKAPAGVTNVRVLVVGGGGGGGAGESTAAGDAGGGGGAGEYRHETSQTVTPGQPVTVTVGNGGNGSTTPQANGGTTAQNGTNGSNSIFGPLTARGGGGGGGNDQHGVSGGSGGGAGGHCTNSSTLTSGGTKTAVSPGIGNNGGSSPAGSCLPRAAAGGGGAGAVGSNGSGGSGGTGAIGLQNDIAGTNTFYAAGGGGGGASSSGAGANGGSGIGGKGGNASGGNGAVGTASTGSGGGGGGSATGTSNGFGGKGGSGVVIVRFATQDITVPTPGGVSGLAMWYKADSAGNTNAQWNDLTGFGYNLTQGTASKQPVLTSNSLNFNPAYVFDGTDDAFSLSGHGIGPSDPMSGFFAALSNSNISGYRYFNEFGDDSPSFSMYNGKPDLDTRVTSPVDFRYSAEAAFTPHVFGYTSPNASGQSKIIGVDGKEETQNLTTGTYVTSSGGFAGNTFGRTNGSSGTSWSGPIAEAMYFNRVLTLQERQKVSSYLAIKYGMTLDMNSTSYINSNGVAVYPSDITFKNNIAGIGRDDTSTLNQKQSKSSVTGDTVTIGHGTIAASNQANTNNFSADRSFLVWGHNGAATNTTTSVTSTYNRIDRIWKAVKTSAVDQIQIRIPMSTVATGNNGVLFVSSSPTFDAGSQRIEMAIINGSEYVVDVTLPTGTSYFTFGSLVGSDIEFVSKTATNIGGSAISSYTPGESMDYVLTVKNNGPDSAGTVTVTDTLPTGLVPVSATGGGWNCNIAGQTVTCTRTALGVGITAPTIVIEVEAASSATGAKLNSATASVVSDPNPNNNSGSLTLPASAVADLAIIKAHGGTPVAGQSFPYGITVQNSGPSDVSSFTVTDTLDPNLTYVSSNPSICSANGQVVTCTGGPLPAGQTTYFELTVAVSSGFVGAGVTNEATVAAPAGVTDPNPDNNSAQDDTAVTRVTDLSVTKSHTGDVIAGENKVFTITVANGVGYTDAAIGDVTVTDTLDEDFSYVSATGADWDCDLLNGTVTCNNTAVIAADTSSDITLTVAVDPIAKGAAANTVRLTMTVLNSNGSNTHFTDNFTIISEADLSLTKGHIGTTFVPGQQEQYTFSVANAGPSADSPSYTITDTLPAGVTFVSTAPDSAASCVGSNGNTVVTCTGGGIGVGDPAQVTTINVNVASNVTGTLNNSATVTPASGITDPAPGNETGNDSVPVEPNADLSISKVPATTVTAGDNATYTIRVDNGGPSDVSGFTVTDTLDPNLTYVSSTGNICSQTGTSPEGGQILTCTYATNVLNGDFATFDIVVTVNASATPASTITNKASVATPDDINDPAPGNNEASVGRTVAASADLQITKSHSGDFTAGTSSNDFTIEVTNAGPSDADTFTVTDTLPAGLTYVSADSTAGIEVTCESAGQIVTCTGNPGIGVGQTSTITLTVAVDADIAGNTVLNNSAYVASATPDPITGNNNSGPDAVTIDSSADLEINKANMTDFTAGVDEEYNVEVINHGPSDVSGFTVTDTLPAGLTYVSAGSDPGCSAVGQDVTCNGGALANGASTNVTIRVHTDSGLVTGAVINNTANVATVAPTTDPDNGNNSSTDSTNIVDVTDLSIEKNPVGTYTAGETGQFEFTVVNAGPSTTPPNDVQVTDSLPGGMTYVSGTGTGWDCSTSAGQSVTCNYAPALGVGGIATLTVTVNIAPDLQGDVQNTGSVLSRLDDSVPANDSDQITVNVGAEADLNATKTTQGAGPFVAGQNITYRFEVTNNGGPSQANNVVITDNLQGNFTYQGFTSVSGGTWNCDESSGTVTCTLPVLDVGAIGVVDITLKLAEDVPNPVENTASVTFDGTLPGPVSPTDSQPVSYSADLGVTLTHESKTYHSGDTVKFTYTVNNYGPSAAEDVVLTDTLPEGLTFDSIIASAEPNHSVIATISDFITPKASAAPNTPFSCSSNGQDITCTTGTLFTGVYVIQMIAQISSSFTGNLTSVLGVTSSTPDPNLSNNDSSDTIIGITAGLSGTGQRIVVWVLAGLSIATLGTLIYRKKFATRPSSR